MKTSKLRRHARHELTTNIQRAREVSTLLVKYSRGNWLSRTAKFVGGKSEREDTIVFQ